MQSCLFYHPATDLKIFLIHGKCIMKFLVYNNLTKVVDMFFKSVNFHVQKTKQP